jgi:hypothetical protein
LRSVHTSTRSCRCLCYYRFRCATRGGEEQRISVRDEKYNSYETILCNELLAKCRNDACTQINVQLSGDGDGGYNLFPVFPPLQQSVIQTT